MYDCTCHRAGLNLRLKPEQVQTGLVTKQLMSNESGTCINCRLTMRIAVK